jgi:elongation factor 2
VPQSIFKTLVNDVRKRKGLNPEAPTADEFIDKE